VDGDGGGADGGVDRGVGMVGGIEHHLDEVGADCTGGIIVPMVIRLFWEVQAGSEVDEGCRERLERSVGLGMGL